MYAVARLSSYISRGVYTVSGPFHPFGGAVDIIVVQQPDGSFKSSPWYVKFGKFQGVLKTREKIVKIDVNGVEADFHMYLDHKGEAYFLSEAVGEEELVELFYSPPSSGDETDEQSQIGCSNESKSGNDVDGKVSVQEIDMGIGKIVTRTNSRRSRIFGLVFGRQNSIKEEIERASSLNSAEIAADLLDMKWSTDLSTDDEPRNSGSNLSGLSTQVEEPEKEFLHINENTFDHPVLHEATAAYDEELGKVSEHGFTNTQCLGEVSSVKSNCSKPDYQDIEVSNLEASDGYPTRAGLRGDCIQVTEDGSDSVLPDVKNLNLPELGVKSCLQSDIESGCGKGNGVHEEGHPQFNAGDVISEVNFRPETGVIMTKTNTNDLGLLSNRNGTPVSSDQRSSKRESDIGYLSTEVPNSSTLFPESVAEDQFFFDDIDQLESSGCHFKESIVQNNMDTKHHPLASMVENEHNSTDKNYYESSQSFDKLPQDCPDVTSVVLLEKSMTKSNPLSIPRSQHVPVEECLMAESLPNIRSHIDSLERPYILHPLSCSVDSSSKSLRWPLIGKEGSISFKLDSDSDHNFLKVHPTIGDTWNSKVSASPFISRMASFDYDHNLEPEGMIAVNKVNQILEESSGIVAPGGSWRWPFSFRRSRTMGSVQPGLDDINISESDNVSESSTYVSKDNNMQKDNIVKKKVKSIVPTSEQLASLNLKEGQNVITFTFSTAMLGKQQVDARIYLWKWNARVVVSDVDGTITKSDVLGQFMPLVGKDWSHTGVAHLFSAIEENGYQLLFLSARAISQAYLTRQFLFSLKQDGKALPDGPVVISPDGLFPSLFREVIRRAPHEFKIACLEDIKALFPPDCNPFYAGFGNRDTDEFSYVKVGIPKGKIFIINPKGQVAVNRSVDLKSYTSIHALVNGMFPAMSSVGKEEFNSWNYWKMPYAEIDV